MSSILSPKQPNTILYFPFSEGSGSTAYDYSDSVNNGTIVAGSYVKAPNGSYSFKSISGNNDSGIVMSAIGTLTNFTILYSGKITVTADTQFIFYGIGSGDTYMAVKIFSTGLIDVEMIEATGVGRRVRSTKSVNSGEYNHIVIVYSGGEPEIYLNGSRLSVTVYVDSGTGYYYLTNNSILGYPDTAPKYGINGDSNYFILLNKAVTAEFIEKHHQETYIQ